MSLSHLQSIDESTLVRSTVLASLWSGYGTITREVHAIDADTITVVRKRVDAPERASRDDAGHTRKMRSYLVERYFYRTVARHVTGAHLPYTYTQADVKAIVMEDMSKDYPHTMGRVDLRQARLVVLWLANFHASCWGLAVETIPVVPSIAEKTEAGVWEEGGYWVLRTRREEYESLNETWKRIAVDVDAQIRAIEPKFLTLIHGDCKVANIALDRARKQCALYDYQYVGRGSGMRDLVYFLISSVSNVTLHEKSLLAYYHESLISALLVRGQTDFANAYTKQVMMEHYELCFIDYYRFMLGWGMWGDSAFAGTRVKIMIEDRIHGKEGSVSASID